MARVFAALFGVFAVLAACQTSADKPAELPRFEAVSAGDTFPVSVPSSFEATRGWLVVAEDRSAPVPREIRLPVAIVRGKGDAAEAPVVYLSGGPGLSGLNAAAYPGAYPWVKDRDFIVMAQRGTQDAVPALICPEFSAAIEAEADKAAAAAACRTRLMSEGIGVEHYNSPASAADLEDLRQVLGIETWTLYGTSYGTRLALTYARNHGEALRAMVLDSPLPPNADYDAEAPANFEAVLGAIADDCAALSACAAAYPNLGERFFERIKALSRNPMTVEGLDAPVKGSELAGLVSIGSPDDVRQAPMVMDAVARLDPLVFEALQADGAASGFAWGIRLSVWCSEAMAFSDRNRDDWAGEALGGLDAATFLPEVCAAWDVPALDPVVREAVVSDVPTLIFAGEFDPLTPPKWGDLAAKTLSNARIIRVRGEAHLPTQQWGGDGCAMALAAAFVADPARDLDETEAMACLMARAAPEYSLPD